MRNATLKASVMSDAPNARAIRISRISPVMRESIVRLLMVASALSRFKMRNRGKRRKPEWPARLTNAIQTPAGS
ncbi:hypothetical protein GCM10009080_04620 [Cupriavidus pauculus]